MAHSVAVVCWGVLILNLFIVVVNGVTFDTDKDELSPSLSAASGPFSNSIYQIGQVYYFQHVGKTLNVTYSLDMNLTAAQYGALSVGCTVKRTGDSLYSFHQLATQTGPNVYGHLGYGCASPSIYGPLKPAVSVTHSLSGSSTVAMSIEFKFSFGFLKVNYEFTLQERTLKFHVFSPNATQTRNNWCGFTIGATANTTNAKSVNLPYMPESIAYFEGSSPSNLYWLSTYIDRSKSGAYQFSQYWGAGDSPNVLHNYYPVYSIDSTATYQPLDEIGYITLSDRVEDVVPFPKYHVSPSFDYYDMQKHRLLLDIWGTYYPSVQVLEPALTWKITCLSPPCVINVTLNFVADSDGGCGDGVIFSILHDSQVLWATLIANNQTFRPSYNQLITITKSTAQTPSYLYFRVNPGASMSCDTTTFAIRITNSENATAVYSTQTDFSSTQGYKDWYYNYIVAGTSEYLPLSFNSSISSYIYNITTSYPRISNGGCHPATTSVALQYLFSHEYYLRVLGSFGIRDLSIIVHDWQHWGYDNKFPDHYPANPVRGGSDGMLKLIETAKSLGHLISLHENYVDMYPDSPLYNISDIAYSASEGIKFAWFNRGTGVRAQQISNEASLHLAQFQQAQISANYKPNAGYEDVDPGNVPHVTINLNASTRVYPPTIRVNVALKKQLWNQFKTSYQGPMFGEGRERTRFDVYFAGYIDGTEAQIEGKAGAALTPEFAQFVVRTSQHMQGMGYYTRWKSIDSEQSVGFPVVVNDIMDKYRLQQVVYGNVGWLAIPSGRWGRPTMGDILAEYHLMQALQVVSRSQNFTSVGYATSPSNLSWLPLANFLHQKGDTHNAILNLTYSSGLSIIANGQQDILFQFWGSDGSDEYSNNWNTQGFALFGIIDSKFTRLAWNPTYQYFSSPSAPQCIVSFTQFFPDSSGNCQPALVWSPPAEFYQPTSYSVMIQVVGSTYRTNNISLQAFVGDFSQANTSTASWKLLLEKSYAIDASNGTVITIPDFLPSQSVIFQATGPGGELTLSLSVMAYKSFATPKKQDISVTANNAQFALPPNGWVAYSEPSSYLAFTARHVDGGLMDYSSSSYSHFARSRDGSTRTIVDIQTDGTVAFSPNATTSMDDIYFTGVSTVTRKRAAIFSASRKIEGSLIYNSLASFALTLTSTTAYILMPTPTTLTFAIPSNWIIPANGTLDSLFTVTSEVTSQIMFPVSATLNVNARTLEISMVDNQVVNVVFRGTATQPTNPPTSSPTTAQSSTTSSTGQPVSSSTTQSPNSDGEIVAIPCILIAMLIMGVIA